MSTIQEKQDLINKKDWDGLSKTDIYSDFDFSIIRWEKYTLNKEFFTKFLYYRSDLLGKALNAGVLKYEDDFVVNSILAALIQNFSVEDIVSVFKAFKILSVKRKKYQTHFKKVSNENKIKQHLNKHNVESFYKTLISDDILNDDFFNVSHIDFSYCSNFTEEELKKIISYETKSTSYISLSSQHSIRKFFPTNEATIDFLIDIPYANIKLSFVLIKNSKTEINDLITFLEKKYAEHNRFLEFKKELIFVFVRNNWPITDEYIDFIAEHFHNSLNFILQVMTKEQIKTKDRHFSFDIIASNNNKLSIDDLLELKPTFKDTNYDLSSSRFFTEEEIIAHPNFFDPNKIRGSRNQYVSEETFRLLNKAWGRRLKYTDLTDVSDILSNLYGDDVELAFFYLMRKANKTSEEILNTIDALFYKFNDESKLSHVREFINKYKN